MARGKGKPKSGHAKKSLGQNFLVDQNLIGKIVNALDPQQNETIIEIGPGKGALTQMLVERAEKVIAIELDRELIPVLRERFLAAENFILIEQDALKVDFGALVNLQSTNRKTKLAANLPYYISTAILQHLIQYRNSFSELVLMLQKEVVDRITAKPGHKERGFLTVLVERYFHAEKLFDVSPNSFRPVPRVMSSVVRVMPISEGKTSVGDEVLFRKLVSAGFAQKRKTIRNNLRQASGELAEVIEKRGGEVALLAKAEIAEKKRGEEITQVEWNALLSVLLGER